jgi:hypothetical protein
LVTVLGERGNGGAVRRGLQLGLHPGRHRVVDGTADRRYQRDTCDRKDHGDIAAPVVAETADQTKQIVHGCDACAGSNMPDF